MKKIQELFLKMQISRALRNNRKVRRTLNYKDVKRVGIIFMISSQSEYHALNKFVDELRQEGKLIECMAYFEPGFGNPFNFPYHYFTDNDIGFWGGIKSDEVERFAQQPFDYLYCVSSKRHLVFDYILASSQASCRIGGYAPDASGFFELMVRTELKGKTYNLVDALAHYTRSIQHNPVEA